MKTTNASESRVNHRIARAKRLLLNPHYAVGEIGDELGFFSVSQFANAFETAVGETPETYRSRVRPALQPLGAF